MPSQSSSPIAGQQQERKANNKTTQTQNSPPESTKSPVVTESQSKQKEDRFQRQSQQSHGDVNWSGWAQVIVAAVGLLIIWRTLLAIKTQVEANRLAADAAKESADAAIAASMPVLSPLIVGGGDLHPLTNPSDQPITFDAYVQFVFENFGKTPGIIRELRADLFLNEMDEFPLVEFERLPIIDYQPIIAGDSRGQNALMAFAEYTKRITLTQTEFAELLAEASNRYRRFAFIGHVIYDDFFENRHTRRFCIKLRLMKSGFFQLVRGGRAYNHVDRQKSTKGLRGIFLWV